MRAGPTLGRRRFLAGAASAAGVLGGGFGLACAGSPRRALPPALARGHAYLFGVQAPDGRFASATYGLLASGQSLTPFVLESLLAAPDELLAPRSADVTRALEAMVRMRDADGALGLTAPSPDYPCYATGLWLSCLGALRPEGWRDLAAPSVAWLRSQQLGAALGWSGHPAQGGWGMGSRTRRTPPRAGHVDLSMTRRVLRGLRAVGVSPEDSALVEARDFVARCQTADGSFVYSPVDPGLNKGLRAGDGRPLGYGSATTDGVLCLEALGLRGSSAFDAAMAWLRGNHRLDRNPGVDGGPMEPFAEAMRCYYRAGSAHCFALAGGPPAWRTQLVAVLTAEQREDGSFVGTSALQKEDDPLIATSFAVQALAATLSARQ